MKGKKICIGLLIFFTTCLLSLNLFSNANAIEQIKVVNNRNPSSVEWTYRDGTGQGEISQSANLEYYVLRGVNLAANANKTAALTNLKINLRSNINLSNKKYYKFTIYYQAHPSYIGDTFSVPVCPRGKAPFVIDECNVTHIQNESEITRIREELLDPSDNLKYSQVYSYTEHFYSMVITGHYNSDTEISKNYIEFQNPFYEFYNNSTINPTTVDLYIYFTPIDEIQYEENPEDEAAEKELEDRDNLESQSTSTDSEANNAGQSAENTGTTLFAAFTQFFNALTNVSGTSCVLPRMQVYSLDLGQMDLCTFDIPPQIMALVSIGMVFIIVPLGIHLVKRMINLYKEITG